MSSSLIQIEEVKTATPLTKSSPSLTVMNPGPNLMNKVKDVRKRVEADHKGTKERVYHFMESVLKKGWILKKENCVTYGGWSVFRVKGLKNNEVPTFVQSSTGREVKTLNAFRNEMFGKKKKSKRKREQKNVRLVMKKQEDPSQSGSRSIQRRGVEEEEEEQEDESIVSCTFQEAVSKLEKEKEKNEKIVEETRKKILSLQSDLGLLRKKGKEIEEGIKKMAFVLSPSKNEEEEEEREGEEETSEEGDDEEGQADPSSTFPSAEDEDDDYVPSASSEEEEEEEEEFLSELV